MTATIESRPNPSTRSSRPVRQAAVDLLAPDPPWIPATPSPLELAAGIGGGLLGAFSSPLLSGPVQRALSNLAPSPHRPPPAPDEIGDPGWFGPDSVAWRVHADPSLLVAGLAAFTLQALHPLAMAGVAEHSAFSEDFFGRTQRTGAFVQGVVYGSSSHAERMCRIVNKVHRQVVGVAPDGRPYDASDPELLEWVHIGEYIAIGAANRRFGLHPMSRRDLDTYVGEVARVGAATGVVDPPTTWLEMMATLERHRPNLSVGEYASAGVSFLDDPPILPGAAKPVWKALWAGGVACLPPVARRLLRLPDPSIRDLATCRALLRTLAMLGEGDGPDLAAAKIRLGLS